MLALLETLKIRGIVYVLFSYPFIYLLFGLLFAKKVEEREEFEILNPGSSVILFPLLSCYPEAHIAVTSQRIFVLRNEMRVGGERITEEETKNKKKKRGKEEEIEIEKVRAMDPWLSLLTIDKAFR